MPRKKEEAEVKTEGWVVKSPNPEYSGVTARLKFYNGQAFIPADYEGAPEMLRYLRDAGYTVTQEGGSGFETASAPNVRAQTLEDILRTPAPIGEGG